ncbi:hypothetical protein F4W09_02470 [Acinetobacter tandoii]|uniref:Restriction endonuclease n=1 Tax=Acinetobacter tandoii TaxID=202954 RepID=A0A5N4WW84_9GAMM|nr:hypothetical protein [Acinetobacter tandoii]KAB1860003.1 hypothetical protein F4W09_02470 [Acinetobacter tandoii]
MLDLRVRNHQDWEELSIYLGDQYYKRKDQLENGRFQLYGRTGQTQHGVDIFSKYHNRVIQCKYTNQLTLNDINKELKKSDSYPNQISHYLFTTTASRDLHVQNYIKNGAFHTRPNLTEFAIDVLYWDDVHSIDFVPNKLKLKYFPSLSFENQSGNLYQLFKNTISHYITLDDLKWLEQYDFSIGYIPEDNYNKFLNLYYESDRAKSNISLIKGKRDALSKTYNIGFEFFDELEIFIKEIRNNIIGENIDGNNVLFLDKNLFKDRYFKIIHNWKTNAKNLARSYREMVLDETPFP